MVTRDLYLEFLDFKLTKKRAKSTLMLLIQERSYKLSNLAIEDQTDQQQKAFTNTKITILLYIKH